MTKNIRSTLIHRAINLYYPASIRAAITLVRLSSLYDPERDKTPESSRLPKARSILDELDLRGTRPVSTMLSNVSDAELWDLIWLQYIPTCSPRV